MPFCLIFRNKSAWIGFPLLFLFGIGWCPFKGGYRGLRGARAGRQFLVLKFGFNIFSSRGGILWRSEEIFRKKWFLATASIKKIDCLSLGDLIFSTTFHKQWIVWPIIPPENNARRGSHRSCDFCNKLKIVHQSPARPHQLLKSFPQRAAILHQQASNSEPLWGAVRKLCRTFLCNISEIEIQKILPHFITALNW